MTIPTVSRRRFLGGAASAAVLHPLAGRAQDAPAITRKQKVFLVDYQMPTDPVNIKVVKRIHDPEFGPLQQVHSIGISHGFGDPPKGANLESRLQNLVWVNNIALGCDYIGNSR